MDADACRHQPVYFGVININVNEKTVGSVDVWRCGACKERFCEEKQLGIEAIADTVGMPKIGAGQRWAVAVCRLQKGTGMWKLVKIGEGAPLKHECMDERVVDLPVKDYAINDGDHWSFLVDDHINKAVEIQR